LDSFLSDFCVSQTGSGKTYTMAGTQSNPGVNIRALHELFEIAQQRSGENDTTLKCVLWTNNGTPFLH